MRRNFTALGEDLNSLKTDLEKQSIHFKKNMTSQNLEVEILSPSNKPMLQIMESAQLMEILTVHFADAEMNFEFGKCQGNDYCVEVNW